MGTILLVRNLSYDVTPAQLQKLFSSAGKVSDVYLVTDRWTATPKGFGFVQMTTEAAAKKAVQLIHDTKWLDRTLLVRAATDNDLRMGGIAPGQKLGATVND